MIFMYIDEGGTMYFEVFSYENLGNMEIVFWAIMADYCVAEVANICMFLIRDQ